MDMLMLCKYAKKRYLTVCMYVYMYVEQHTYVCYIHLVYTFNKISVDASFKAGSHCLKTSVE